MCASEPASESARQRVRERERVCVCVRERGVRECVWWGCDLRRDSWFFFVDWNMVRALLNRCCIIFDIPGKMAVSVLCIECINLVLEEALQRGAQCYKCV